MRKKLMITSFVAFLTTLTLFGANGFSEAIVEGDAEKVKKIIKANPEVVNEKTTHRGLPLSLAVSKGQVEIVKLLLENGADVNAQHPETKENAVFRLLDEPQTEENLKKAIEIIALLKEHKADFNIINHNNITALYAFCIGSLPRKALETKLQFIETLINSGAEMDIKLKKRDEPLLNAVLMKVLKSDPFHIEVAKLLIKLGAPVNRKSEKDAECADKNSVTEDDTPLIIVMKREGFQAKERTEMIKLLVEHGARTTARNKDGETPKKLLDKRDSFYKDDYNALRKTKVKKRNPK